MSVIEVSPSPGDPQSGPFPIPARPADERFAAEDLLLENLPLVERLIRSSTHPSWSRDQRQEFRSLSLLHLVDNDFAVLRKFKRQASLSTFLTTVLRNLARDYQNHCWGKWRPCAAAKRLGGDGVDYDRLLNRDRLTGDEVEQRMHDLYPSLTDERLLALTEAIPSRVRKSVRSLDAMDSSQAAECWTSSVAPDGDPDVCEQADHALTALEVALSNLCGEDRALLRARFLEGQTIRGFAKARAAEPKECYRRLRLIVASLRTELKAHLENRTAAEGDAGSFAAWLDARKFDLEAALR